MRHPPGLIGVACGENARYSDFYSGIVQLAGSAPPGSKFLARPGLGPARPFNSIAEEFLLDKKLEWLFLTNDDNLVPLGAIQKLLDHKVDVVSGLYFSRIQPFEPVLFDSWTIKKAEGKSGRWYNRHLMAPGEKGLVKAVAVGDGCLLIRRHVLEGMSDPWWEYGETMSDLCDHDVVFSRKVIEAGFEIYCDLDLVVDHITSVTIRPVREADGEWYAYICQADRAFKIHVPKPGQTEIK